MDLEGFQTYLEEEMDKRNNRAIPNFEGYSPIEMHYFLYAPFESNSPIVLQQLDAFEYELSPLFNLVKYYLLIVQKQGEIKLTAKGYLPTKIVLELYNQGFIEEYMFASGISKLCKESDSITINLTKILADLAGLTKKRSGKLSLTKTGEKALSNNQVLFELVFKTLLIKFNWAYYDGYENEDIGQFGVGFSLLLLAKYGDEKRLNEFYSQKYFRAFPYFKESVAPTYGSIEQYVGRCYSVRTFERYLKYLGLITIDGAESILNDKRLIQKADLFDKLIQVQSHKGF